MPDLTDFAARYDPTGAERMTAATLEMSGIPKMTGLRIVRFAPGRLWAQADLDDSFVTPSGNVHGGAVAAVLDHITGAVVYPLMPAGWWGATTELKLNYVAPVRPGPLLADATVLSLGNRTAVVRGEAYCDDRLVCAAQGTIALVAPRTAPPEVARPSEPATA